MKDKIMLNKVLLVVSFVFIWLPMPTYFKMLSVAFFTIATILFIIELKRRNHATNN